MATENNFSNPRTSPSNSAALWQHYWQHLWLGVGIWVGIGLSIILYGLILSALPTSSRSSEDDVVVVGFFFIFLLFFTIPAALGGLIRQPTLAWLSRHARTRGELVGGSLLLFEALVLVVIILSWCYLGLDTPINLWNSFLFCFFASLPWLFSTAWASWHLAAKIGLPVHRQ